jgi:hypothetical protein
MTVSVNMETSKFNDSTQNQVVGIPDLHWICGDDYTRCYREITLSNNNN